MPLHILLDTDIGTDVDDCLALALLLRSPELEPVGITCVYGDVALRARMVRHYACFLKRLRPLRPARPPRRDPDDARSRGGSGQ